MFAALAPRTEISEAERETGLRRLIYEAGYSGATAALTSGVILTAFALHLGASNLTVGVLASAPFLGQLLQAPAVLLIERLRPARQSQLSAASPVAFRIPAQGRVSLSW